MAITHQKLIKGVDRREQRLDFVVLLVVQVEYLLNTVAAVDLVHHLRKVEPGLGGLRKFDGHFSTQVCRRADVQVLQIALESRVALRVEVVEHHATLFLLPEPQIARLGEFCLGLATFVHRHNIVPINERNFLANVVLIDRGQTQV